MNRRLDHEKLEPTATTSTKRSRLQFIGSPHEAQKISKLCDGADYMTQDIVIQILGTEEDHRREFIGFLTEYEKR